MSNLDIAIFKWLNSWAGVNGFYDWAIIFRAEYLPWVVGVLVIIFIFWSREHTNILKNVRISAEAVLAALISRFVFTEIIRFFYDRPRPFEVLQNVHQLIQYEIGGSFPSGHAAFFFALAAGVFFYRKWWGILFYALAFSISIGRVAAGLHWPSDILGGAVVGLVSAWMINLVINKIKNT